MGNTLSEYGAVPDICDRMTRVIRHGLQLFDRTALPLIPTMLAQLTSRFETTGFANYLWAVAKIIQRFGLEEDLIVRNAIQAAYERCTVKCLEIFASSSIALHSDGMISSMAEQYRELTHVFSGG